MQLPGPLRAAVGLIAAATDEAKHLPDRAIELPMLALSSALQVSLRAQQHYARLAARGDEVLNRQPVGEEAPEWATFDEPVPVAEPDATDPTGSPRRAQAADAPPSSEHLPLPGTDVPPSGADADPAGGADSAKTTRARPASTRGSARKSAKTVSKPRHTNPSRFDTVDDE